jgi:hypothetical protein
VYETGREILDFAKKIYYFLVQLFEVPVKSLKSPVGVTSGSAAKTQHATVTAQNTSVIQVSLALLMNLRAIDKSVLSVILRRPAFAYVNTHRKTSLVTYFIYLGNNKIYCF